MIIPPYLKKNDTIAIAATARHVDENIIIPIVHIFESWGIKVKLAENIYSKYNALAGDDELRANSLQKLLDDDEVKAIIIARGGYGTIRIIDKLDFTKFNSNPKWICGYSDVTILHSHIIKNYNTATLHSCMPITMGNEASIESLKNALFGNELNYSFNSNTLNRKANCEGIIVGGNLSVLYSLMGSTSDMDWADKILFIEDIGEYYYHIDRIMIGLKRAGKLKNLKALLVGGMTNMSENDAPFAFNKTCEQIIKECVNEYDYPIFFDFPAGHQELNFAIKMGCNTTIEMQGDVVNVRM